MRIANNLSALTAFNALNSTSSAMSKSIQQLSTGLRINSAADDAAGFAISEKIRAQTQGLDTAIRNAQDGVSLLQTAEGALSQTHSILQRMRELSVQASNDTLTANDREYIQLEIDELKDEINNIANTTQFNKKRLLDGSSGALWSSGDLNTKVSVRGGLTDVDDYGQKISAEGNYNIEISAEAGAAQVQKSSIFKIINREVPAANVPSGVYTVETVDAPSSTAERVNMTGQYIQQGGVSDSVLYLNPGHVRLSRRATEGTVTITDGTNTLASVTVTVTDVTNGKTRVEVFKELWSQLEGETAQAIAAQNGYTLKVTSNYSEDMDDYANGGICVRAYRMDGQELDSTLTVDVGTTSINGYVEDEDVSLRPMSDLITVYTGDFRQGGRSRQMSSRMWEGNASILLEVTSATGNDITLKATANILREDGTTETRTVDNVTFSDGSDVTSVADILDDDLTFRYVILDELIQRQDMESSYTSPALVLSSYSEYMEALSVGDKIVYNLTMDPRGDGADDVYVQVSGTQYANAPYNWANKNSGVTDNPVTYGLDANSVSGQTISLPNYYLNENTSEVSEGLINITFPEGFSSSTAPAGAMLLEFDTSFVGQVADGKAKLSELDKFYNSSGVFMLDEPQTLTITQGDGRTARVTLYANDTLEDMRAKLNDAIAEGLGQAQYASGDTNHFVSFVERDGATDNTSESVEGTFVIRSMVSGKAGELSFSGDEDLLNALGLNTIQASSESSYTASVYDAHTGNTIASGVKVTGNKLLGVIHENVDVEFDPMPDIKAEWDDNSKRYVLSGGSLRTTVHLSDNSMAFQIGANKGEDMYVNIGDMSADALGITSVNVSTRERAAKSIGMLDRAITRVSEQRAKIGAYQNALEVTSENLTETMTNLTAAESRISDTDMAKSMMEFVKLQILNQSGTSMLAQANQLPQGMLNLIR